MQGGNGGIAAEQQHWQHWFQWQDGRVCLHEVVMTAVGEATIELPGVLK